MAASESDLRIFIPQLIEAFEKINDFSRELRSEGRFFSVLTGSDLRKYESGWAIEKYVEASLDKHGHDLVWWMEFRCQDNAYKITCNVSISHSDYYMDVYDRVIDFNGDVQATLPAAVRSLVEAESSHSEIARWISDLSG